MSITSTEISQTIESAIDRALPDIEQEVSELFSTHQHDQPYVIKCAACGDALECSTDVDDDLDITVEVKPCEYCMKEAASE